MKERARDLRKHQTDAERTLWFRLRDRRLLGYKFRRQHPIGPFVVDFACLESRLIIEIDGGQHALQAEEDSGRTGYLEAQGFKVLRFWNNEVLGQLEAVLAQIVSILESKAPSP